MLARAGIQGPMLRMVPWTPACAGVTIPQCDVAATFANLRNEVLGWESADQVVAGDPAAYVLPQHFGNRRDGGRAGACFLDGNGPGDR